MAPPRVLHEQVRNCRVTLKLQHKCSTHATTMQIAQLYQHICIRNTPLQFNPGSFKRDYFANTVYKFLLALNFLGHYFSIQKSSWLAEPWGSWSLLLILARHKYGTQKAKALIISNSSSNIHLHFCTFSFATMWSTEEYFCSAFYKRYVCFSRNIFAKTVCE